jgi:hypothetical protein
MTNTVPLGVDKYGQGECKECGHYRHNHGLGMCGACYLGGAGHDFAYSDDGEINVLANEVFKTFMEFQVRSEFGYWGKRESEKTWRDRFKDIIKGEK